MITPENIALFFLVLMALFVIVYVAVKLKPNGSISREDQLESEIKQLVKRIASLQETIDILSSRITELQGQVAKLKDENERLRSDLNRYLSPVTKRKTNELSVINNALGKLSADEFKRLVFEKFRAVYDSFGADQTLQAQRLTLVEYADNHNQLSLLRTSIIDINPVAFDG
jgi:chromosome segregation ATPase